MAIVDQAEQPGQAFPTDFDQSAVESVKVERNTKGYNWSFRIVKKEGESWEKVIEKAKAVNDALRQEFGN